MCISLIYASKGCSLEVNLSLGYIIKKLSSSKVLLQVCNLPPFEHSLFYLVEFPLPLTKYACNKYLNLWISSFLQPLSSLFSFQPFCRSLLQGVPDSPLPIDPAKQLLSRSYRIAISQLCSSYCSRL